MAEWLYEAGIGEARAALVEDGAIVEARIERDHEGPPVGTVQHARLIEAGKKPLAMLDGPGEQLVSLARLPPAIPIGSQLKVEITREALMERGRDKLGRAKIADPDASLISGRPDPTCWKRRAGRRSSVMCEPAIGRSGTAHCGSTRPRRWC